MHVNFSTWSTVKTGNGYPRRRCHRAQGRAIDGGPGGPDATRPPQTTRNQLLRLARDDIGACGIWRTSTKCPAIAAAAAIAGLTRWVRPPFPCRPSKLRFEVLAQRSPGAKRSSFIAQHMLQPGSRHSKPAARKMSARPSASAYCLTRPLPGTTIARTVGATCLPWTRLATRRKSSIRLLVQLPIKTRSREISWMGVPGCNPMYASAR